MERKIQQIWLERKRLSMHFTKQSSKKLNAIQILLNVKAASIMCL